MNDEKSMDNSNLSGSFTDEKGGSTEFVHGNLASLDVGLKLVTNTEDEDFSPKEMKRLRRKIDCFILPLLCLIYTG